MIIVNENILNEINSPVRHITARVELYNGSTLVDTFNHDDRLIDFTVERVCEEGKFFGFGICQHLKVNIIDTKREIDYITTDYSMKVAYGVNNEYIYTHPVFHITQTRRDENTNELTIYGYDVIYDATKHQVSKLDLIPPYTIQDVAKKTADYLGANGMAIQRLTLGETCFATIYEDGANLEGTETLREVLDDIAEATQTIYFVNNDNQLVFKRLDDDREPDVSITKSCYFSLETGEGRRLKTICHATELGDNVSASMVANGSTQYVRDNFFWDLRPDIDTLVDNALAAVGGMSIRQFECLWRGNFLVELGDKIALTTKDDDIVISYLLDDTIEYNGVFQQESKYSYDDSDEDSESNPTSLGDVLRQTYARVDKANKQIELLTSESEANSEAISSLILNTESISASVKSVEEATAENITKINDNVATLTSKVDASITAEDVKFEIQTELSNGVDKVITSTGFTFDEEGLLIEKSGSEMTTQITEDGMKVYRDNTEVLVANNIGVEAINLHAHTYLIIGENSRFEDYNGGARTGCFWIGSPQGG